jgi:ABC-2 type transport system permease protein
MSAFCGKSFAVFKRDLKSYFESPVAYVFLVAFLLLTSFFTFSVGKLYERNVADLQPFFMWHPWLFLLLVPAATMGLWAEERRSGTIELLLTMPLTMLQAIMGKFFAAWAFMTLAILLTFPVALTVMHLGSPDTGVLVCQYAGSILLAGAYVSVGMLTSSMTRSQVISFILSLVICLLLLLAGWEPVTSLFEQWAPTWLVDGVASMSFMPHFDSISRGVVDLRDIAYFVSVMVLMIFATHIVIENRKSA